MRHATRRRTPWWAGALAATIVGLFAVMAPAAPAWAEDLQIRQLQWHLDYLRIADAQKISAGQGVIVAVVDSGVQATHPDLAGQVDAGVDLTPGTDDGTAGRRDHDGHGTAMAALIAAKGGGPTHAYGIAPGVRILPIRVIAAKETPPDKVGEGIRAAADRGAKVINVSLGVDGAIQQVPRDAQQLRDAVAYALAKDAVVVAAAGNTEAGDHQVAWPAGIPGVIAVTGCDQQGQFWSGSVQGPEAALCAPAKDIVSADSPAGYGRGNGTSEATAIVSGVVALVRARYPQLDAANVINRLIRTADDAGPTGRDPQYGFGRVNPLRALTEQVAPVTSNPLGSPSTSTSTTANASAISAGPGTGTAAQDSGSAAPGILVAAGTAAVLLVIVVIFLASRRRRPATAAAPGPTQGPAPNAPPSYPPPPSASPTGPPGR